MKKILSFIVLAFLMLVIVGCGKEATLKFGKDSFEVTVGQELVLEPVIENSEEKVTYTVSADGLKLVEGNKFLAEAVGSYTITAKLEELEVKITVTVVAKGAMTHAEFTAAELDSEVVVDTYILARQGWWSDDAGGKASFYTQNEEAGYFVYNLPCTEEQYNNELKVGTKIRVKGIKAEWSGEVEIIEATYEVLDGTYTPSALDLTNEFGAEDLIKHQNKFITLKGLKVVASNEEGAAFLYKWNGTGKDGDDLYFNVELGGKTYTLTVESYLCGKGTEVYEAVKALKVGDMIDVEGFLYWYEGPQPHITKVTVVAKGAMTYEEFLAAELDDEVVVDTYILARQGWWSDDAGGKASFYTQNEEAGYFVYNLPCTEEQYNNELKVGTKIRVKGIKAEWSGEVEIIEATYEVLDGTYTPSALDLTNEFGAEDLIKHQNKFITLKGLKVVASNEEGAAFLYKWNGTGKDGDDLYFNVELGGKTYTLTVESYLCGKGTEVYEAVKALKVGDMIDVEGFLYWYEGPQPHITKVSASTYVKPELTLSSDGKVLVGETLKLDVKTNQEGTIKWSSSDATVATVADGVVTGVKAGEVTITAEINGLKAEVKVVVEAKAELKLDGEKEVYVGSTTSLVATLTGSDAKVEFVSSDDAVATVDASGVVTGVKAGKATITAKAGELEAKLEVTVKDVPQITYEGSLELEIGATLQLNYELEGSWESSDEAVATVSNGLVAAVKAGEATITVKAGELSASVKVVVKSGTFKVTFLDRTGKELAVVEVKPGEAAKAPEAPAVSGYEFDKWDVDFSNVQSDLTVKAIYKQLLKITYVALGGTLPADAVKSFKAGEDVTLPVPTRDGYMFLGWTKIRGGKDYITELKGQTSNITLYANWLENSGDTGFTVGTGQQFATISDALKYATEGSTITVVSGTYSEQITIDKNNITLVGPNAEISAVSGTRNPEAVINGNITVADGVVGLTVKGFELKGSNVIAFSGNTSNVVVKNNIMVGKISAAGSSGDTNAVIDFAGNATNVEITFNKITLDSSVGYTSAVDVAGISTNINISDNYMTSTTSTDLDVFTVVLRSLTGDISVNRNEVIRFAGNYWTYWFTSVKNNAVIEVCDNNIDGLAAATAACGIAIDGLLNDTMYLYFIGNKFSYCKDTVLGIRGSGTSDSTSNAHVKVMYNQFLNTSSRMRFGMNKANFYFGNNYAYQAWTDQSSSASIKAPEVAKDDYTSVELLEAAYAEYKKSYDNTFGKIEYVLDGGQLNAGSRYVIGSVVKLPTPVREESTFLGWSLVEGGTDYITELPATQTGDVKLYANWIKLSYFEIEFDHDGGVSNDLYVAKGNATTTIEVHNYNYNESDFWGGGYATQIFIGNSSCDPTATFSDRIYIGKDSVSGLYVIKGILVSGGSSWAEGAEYVLTISSSCSYYRTYHNAIQLLQVGQVVGFSKPLAEFTNAAPGQVYFYTDAPTESVITSKLTSNDQLITPSKLGYEFLGWYDAEGNLYDSILDVQGNCKLKAKWKELNPVTDIVVSDICTEMVTYSTYQIAAKVAPADAYFQDVYYESNNPDVVSVDKAGLLTAGNAGTATITIYDYMKKVVKTFDITVYPITSLDVNFEDDATGILEVGKTTQLKAYALGKDTANATFTYKSNNEAILTVDANGLVTAVAEGVATITVSDNNPLTNDLDVAILVSAKSTATKVDEIVELIKANNFAVVQTGNACLYNDGVNRVYDSMYGSVNNYLFDEFVVDSSYAATAEANTSGHRDRRPTDQIEFVTVHDTATLTGTVESIANVMSTGETSIHYTVGNDKILQVVPEKYIAYHAGDGTGVAFQWQKTGVKATSNDYPEFDIVQDGGKWYFTINGQKTIVEAPISDGNKTIQNPSKENLPELGHTWKIVDGEYYVGNNWVCFSQNIKGIISSRGGNNNSIGIEMCVNYTNDIYDTFQRTAQLVADILIRNNLDPTRVKQHNTYSGKGCPQVLLAGGNWWDFMEMVDLNYEIMKNYSGAKITMKSNNPEIVDNTGRVVNAPLTTCQVSYDVTVELDGVSKTITLYSVIPGTTTWEMWDGSYPSKLVWNNGKFARKY